jgi:hypothetical protein
VDRSIVAWPARPGLVYLQQRSTNRTFQADIEVPNLTDMVASEEFYATTLAEFVTKEYPELAYQRGEPWWKLPDGQVFELPGSRGRDNDLIANQGWYCITDCGFGEMIGQEMALETSRSPGLEPPDPRLSAGPRPVVCITATLRVGLLALIFAAGHQPILPVFEFRSQLLVGPVLSDARCPCRVCLHARLAANDISLDAFTTRCIAAESYSPLFTSRDLVQGLSESAAHPAVEAAAYAIRAVAASYSSDQSTSMIRIDLSTGIASTREFNPLPGPHSDHWAIPKFKDAVLRGDFNAIDFYN